MRHRNPKFYVESSVYKYKQWHLHHLNVLMRQKVIKSTILLRFLYMLFSFVYVFLNIHFFCIFLYFLLSVTYFFVISHVLFCYQTQYFFVISHVLFVINTRRNVDIIMLLINSEILIINNNK